MKSAGCTFALTSLVALLFALRGSAQICRLPRDDGWFCATGSQQSAYYYDVIGKDCKQFRYLGCGGNANRYNTLVECQNACGLSSECPAGMPVLDPAGNIQRCVKGSMPCPPGFECVADDVMPPIFPAVGICCAAKASVCGQNVDRGSRCIGTPIMNRFFYDPMSKFCREFTYFGCAGNDNNFATRGECIKFCADNIVCPRGDPLPQKASTHLRECDNVNPCPDEYDCIRQGRDSACCPTAAIICKEEKDSGTLCSSGQKGVRWFFNRRSGLCEEFDYNGCRGNLNNFVNSEQCQSFCMGSCPSGSDMYVSPLTGQVQLCQRAGGLAGNFDACPPGYLCSLTTGGTNICCKAPARCPGESEPFLAPNGLPTPCVPSDRVKTCPDAYKCTKSTTKENICCTTPLECPSGFLTLRDAVGQPPRLCTPGVPGTCPDTYDCTMVRNGEYNLCCKPNRICIMPYVDPRTYYALACAPSQIECPPQTSCLVNMDDSKYYCCYDMDYSLCGDGSIPYIEPLELTTKRCLKGSYGVVPATLTCPRNFECADLQDMTYGCCRQALVEEMCKVAHLSPVTNAVTECRKEQGNKQCPNGTFCQRASNTKYYCCEK